MLTDFHCHPEIEDVRGLVLCNMQKVPYSYGFGNSPNYP